MKMKAEAAASLKNTKDQEEREERTVSLAAANEISVDAAMAVVLPELDISSLEEEQRTGLLNS